MSEYMLFFRNPDMQGFTPSPEEIQATIQVWQDWIGNIAAQGKLVSTQRLGFNGKVVKQNASPTDGPYIESKEVLGGYLILKADSIEEAAEYAKTCPILFIGGNVEVRDII